MVFVVRKSAPDTVQLSSSSDQVGWIKSIWKLLLDQSWTTVCNDLFLHNIVFCTLKFSVFQSIPCQRSSFVSSVVFLKYFNRPRELLFRRKLDRKKGFLKLRQFSLLLALNMLLGGLFTVVAFQASFSEIPDATLSDQKICRPNDAPNC